MITFPNKTHRNQQPPWPFPAKPLPPKPGRRLEPLPLPPYADTDGYYGSAPQFYAHFLKFYCPYTNVRPYPLKDKATLN